jgi:hypothetical protein
MSRLALVLLAAAACGSSHPAATPDAAAQPDAATAPDAGPPPAGLALSDHAIAVDLTPDGRTAVFEDLSSTAATAVLVDTITGQITGQVEIGDPSLDLATGVSADLHVVAFHGMPSKGGTWSQAGGWVDVVNPFPKTCDTDDSATWDISADGKVVVGMLWNGCDGQAFRASGGAVALLDLLGEPQTSSSPPQTNRATVVSDDGAIAAGWAERTSADRSPAAWTADGHGFLLDPEDAATPGEVLSIDADGRVMAGILGGDGFVWTKGTGLAKLLRFDQALPSDPVYPNAMTADGSIVFGGVGDAFLSTPIAFAWTERGGMVSLADVAKAGGVTVPDGVTLNSVLGASADGTVTIGTAMDAAGASKTFVLRVPASALTP